MAVAGCVYEYYYYIEDSQMIAFPASPGPTSEGTIKGLGVQLLNFGGPVPHSLSSLGLLFLPLHPGHPHFSALVTHMLAHLRGAPSLFPKSLWVFQMRLRNSTGCWYFFYVQ